jgi:hypothetical protein
MCSKCRVDSVSGYVRGSFPVQYPLLGLPDGTGWSHVQEGLKRERSNALPCVRTKVPKHTTAPLRWLQKNGHLANNVEFYFLTNRGKPEILRNALGTRGFWDEARRQAS